MKHAQAATEYLIVLAVVIIIALAVIDFMGGIPGIGAGARDKASAAYWGSTDIAIPAFANSATDGITLSLKNNMRGAITITEVKVGTSADLAASDITLAPGKTSSVSGTIIPTCTAGQSFSYDVSITYTDSATGKSYTFAGDGTKLEGTCAG